MGERLQALPGLAVKVAIGATAVGAVFGLHEASEALYPQPPSAEAGVDDCATGLDYLATYNDPRLFKQYCGPYFGLDLIKSVRPLGDGSSLAELPLPSGPDFLKAHQMAARELDYNRRTRASGFSDLSWALSVITVAGGAVLAKPAKAMYTVIKLGRDVQRDSNDVVRQAETFLKRPPSH